MRWFLVAVVLLTALPLTGTDVAAAGLYPDLRTSRPTGLYFDRATIGGSSHYVVRFDNTVWNAGEGRLELQGDPNPSGSNLIYQNIYDSTTGGSRVSQRHVSSDIIYHPSHYHYHFEGFASYLLLQRDADGVYKPTTKKGSKTGFCIMDVSRIASGGPSGKYYDGCGESYQGLSVGWGDVYEGSLPDQWIDLGTSPLPSGAYAIQSTADPANKLDEAGRDDNNVGITYFTVSGSGGISTGSAPTTAACGVSPASPKVGDTVTLSCSGFAAREPVSAEWGDAPSPPVVTATADKAGLVEAQLTIPETPGGSHSLIVSGDSSGRQDTVSVTVAPSLSRVPTEGVPGTTVEVTVRAFGASETVSLTWGSPTGPALGSVTTSDLGSGTTTVTIPQDTPGWHDYVGTGEPSGLRAYGAIMVLEGPTSTATTTASPTQPPTATATTTGTATPTTTATGTASATATATATATSTATPPTPTPSPTPTVAPTQAPTMTGTVSNTGGSGLRCRTGPSTGYATITILPAGSTVPVRGPAQGGWYPVTCAGQDGWVYAQHLTVTSSGGGNPTPTPTQSPSGATGTVTNTGGAGLNCRSGPSTSYGVIAILAAGSTVAVRGAQQGGWWPVVCGGQSGWVSAQYLSVSGTPAPTPTATATVPTPTPTVTTTPTATPTPPPATGMTGTVVNTGGAGLRCRTQPSTAGAIITTLAAGSTVPVRGAAEGGWYPVVCAGQNGWVSAQYLSVSGAATTPTSTPPPEGRTGTVFNTGGDNVRCRTQPATSAAIITNLREGDVVPVRGDKQDNWWPITCASRDGWVYADYLNVPDATPTPTPLSTTAPAEQAPPPEPTETPPSPTPTAVPTQAPTPTIAPTAIPTATPTPVPTEPPPTEGAVEPPGPTEGASGSGG